MSYNISGGIMKKHKKLLIIISGIVSLLFIIFICYFGDYYHAVDIDEYITTNETVIVKDEKYLTFEPTSEIKGGIIFYPGAKVEYTSYSMLMYELSENGYFCVLVDMPLNFAIFGMNKADDIISRYSDIESWHIMGHSLGGAMASSYAGSNKDKIDSVILLAAYSTADLDGLNVLSIYGSNDNVLNLDKYKEYLENLPDGYCEVIIEGGNHAYFGSYGEQKGDGESLIARDEQIGITVKEIIDFLD